jgi:hypothetical protein
VLKQLARHFIVFAPAAFPDVFAWTTYGLGVVLEKVYADFNSMMDSVERKSLAPYYLELGAVIERLIAYGYTGSSRVLIKGIMEPLWVTFSLKATCVPMLRRSMVNVGLGVSAMVVNVDAWPLLPSGLAAMASMCAQTRTYSSSFADVSISVPLR